MNTIIKFRNPTTYRGRNGIGTQVGIELANIRGALQILPVNTKGVSDAAWLEVPAENVPDYIAGLKVLYPEHFQPQTSLFSYSTDGDYRGTLQIVAENLACANTALVHFLDEEKMGQADPPMSADDWKLNFVVPVGGDIKRIDGDVTIAQGESVVLDYDWMKI